jgi:hypothetical protein
MIIKESDEKLCGRRKINGRCKMRQEVLGF